MPVLEVTHRTTYRYDRPVAFGEHRWMFRPRDSQEQRLISVESSISPPPNDLIWIHDVFGNQIAISRFGDKATQLAFESRITVDHSSTNVQRFTIDEAAVRWPFTYAAMILPDLQAYRHVHYPDPTVEEWTKQIAENAGGETMQLLLTLTAAVRESCTYTRRSDPGTQQPAVTLARRSGTCRDFALLMMEAARSLGLAARFVTGYLYVPTRDTGRIRGGGATHAWVQIFVPGAGWVEFDPTNGIIGSRDLIRVGVARDPRQAKPLAGSFTGAPGSYLGMDVEVTVRKHSEPPSNPPHEALTLY